MRTRNLCLLPPRISPPDSLHGRNGSQSLVRRPAAGNIRWRNQLCWCGSNHRSIRCLPAQNSHRLDYHSSSCLVQFRLLLKSYNHLYSFRFAMRSLAISHSGNIAFASAFPATIEVAQVRHLDCCNACTNDLVTCPPTACVQNHLLAVQRAPSLLLFLLGWNNL